jgi:hypothetical protein
MTDQQQRGGIGSQNLQIGVVNVGLRYEDVRAIAKDVFDANFATLTAEARIVSEDRASSIREKIVTGLQAGEGDASSFCEVEKQVALLEAQKGFALSGDEELRDLLVRAVLQISKEKERSLKSIVLQECIKVMPTLTPSQLSTLTLAFMVRQVNFGVSSLQQLFDNYVKYANITEGGLNITLSDFRHLEYCGCGRINPVGNLSLFELIRGDYPGLITRGFDESDLIAAFQPDPIPDNALIFSIRSPGKFQIAAINQRRVDDIAHGWSQRQLDVAKAKLRENLESESDFISEINQMPSPIPYLVNQWTETAIKSFEVTSVGIAISHTMLSTRGVIGELEIWL